jgi:LacI family transcriptional regulator
VNQPIAIVMSEVFLRRLTPSLTPFARKMKDYRVLSIHRSIDELGPMLMDLQPSGLITEWLPEKTDQLLQLKLNIPTIVVATDQIIPSALSADVDDWAVGREAAETFSFTGFRNLACLGNGTPYSDQRIEGFKKAFSNTELPFSVYIENGFEDTRYSESFHRPSMEMNNWLELLPKPVGIFAVHDPLGRFLCSACTQLGLEIPTDVSVIGANNDPLVCGLTYPMLSSVSIPWDTLGEQVATAMEKMIAGEKLQTEEPILVQPSGVILRHSANHLALEDPLLRRAMSFLNERMQAQISIGILCEELNIPRRTLERKFKEQFKCTPWEMLCQLRVKKAKQLLAETNHPMSMVSELSGFNDAERMAVVFKRITGNAPSSFRKILRNQI